MESEKKCKLPPGRPREFDADQALRRALHLFWSKGYEGTSLSDLTDAMAISRPSLYAAFGNKETVFRKALELYRSEERCAIDTALQAPTARESIELFMRAALAKMEDSANPSGCLLVQGALACSDESEPIRTELTASRAKLETIFRRRFEQARADGELPPETNPADLARYFATFSHGMSVQAAGGATATELREVIRIAFHAWPGKDKPQL